MTELKQNKLFSVYTAYFCLLTVYMAVREVLPLNFLIESTVVSGVIFAMALVLILIDLFTEQNCLKGRMSDLLIFFLIVCVVSSLINFKYGVFGNLKIIAALAIEFLLLFPFSKGKEEDQKEKLLNAVSVTLIVIWGVFTLFSLMMYFFSVDFLVRGLGSWGLVNQGFSNKYGRLWGIFQDPNYAGTVCIISIILSARLILKYKKVLLSVLLAVNIIGQLFFIVLGGSRASLIIISLCTALAVLWKTVFSARFQMKRLLCGVVLSAVSVAVIFGAFQLVKISLPAVKAAAVSEQTAASVNGFFNKFYSVSSLDYFPADSQDDIGRDDPQHPGNDKNDITRTDLDNMSDISNGRFKRWKDTIKIFLKTPVFGTSPRNTSAFAKEHCPDTLMAKYGIVSHNGYLDVLVSTGIIGFVILAAAVILGLIKILPLFFSSASTAEICQITVLLAAIAVSAFFVSDVFMTFSMGSFLFWLFFGMDISYGESKQKNGLFQTVFNKIFKRKRKA